jgi:hypothetical protein
MIVRCCPRFGGLGVAARHGLPEAHSRAEGLLSSPDCHSSCMLAAGLAVPAVVQPDGPVG